MTLVYDMLALRARMPPPTRPEVWRAGRHRDGGEGVEGVEGVRRDSETHLEAVYLEVTEEQLVEAEAIDGVSLEGYLEACMMEAKDEPTDPR
jgi:hypothetical protein